MICTLSPKARHKILAARNRRSGVIAGEGLQRLGLLHVALRDRLGGSTVR
jgi:hypothetical protein